MSRFIAGLAAVLLIVATHNSYAQTAVMTKGEVQAIIKDYLTKNPEVVIDALEAYREKQEKQARAKTQEAIEKNKTSLFNNPTVPSVGPQDADVVIAEFFDYHCGYCKHMLPTITKLLEEDKKVRIVFHELPILSEDSRLAAKAALAVYQLKPSQYFAYHSALMKMPGKYTKETLTKHATKLGVDGKKFTEALDKKELDNALKSSADLARNIGISGTPAFVINDEFIPGASSLESMKKMIAEQRKAKKK